MFEVQYHQAEVTQLPTLGPVEVPKEQVFVEAHQPQYGEVAVVQLLQLVRPAQWSGDGVGAGGGVAGQ